VQDADAVVTWTDVRFRVHERARFAEVSLPAELIRICAVKQSF
jgi:hypothetical protein